MKYSTLRGDALLLLAAILWGGAFVAQRAAMQHLGPLTFTGVRFALGALALLPVVIMLGRSGRIRGSVSGQALTPWSQVVPPGVIAGSVLFLGIYLQQAGMVYTTAGKAGFITGLYMPLVPIFGLLVGERTGAATWLGAALAVVGLYFLSVSGPLQVNRGDLLVMICAVVWAVHVLLIARFAPQVDPVRLAFVQFTVVAVVGLVAAALREQATQESLLAARWAILYGGLVSVGIAFTLQVVGQRDAPPGHAALLLSLEAVFAGISGFLVLGERLSPREMLGAAIMFAGMLVSQFRRVLAPPEPEPEPGAFPVVQDITRTRT